MQVSLIIPTYNASVYIAESIDRLLKVLETLQVPHELILVDDCSRDTTWQVLQQCKVKYEGQVRIIRNHENIGQIRSIAVGARLATGGILITYNDDLDVSEQFIPEMYRALHQGNDLVYLDYPTRSDSPVENLFSSVFNNAVRWLLRARGKVSNHRAWRAELLDLDEEKMSENTAFLDYRLLRASNQTIYLPCPPRTRAFKTSKHGFRKKMIQSLYVLRAIISERWTSRQ